MNFKISNPGSSSTSSSSSTPRSGSPANGGSRVPHAPNRPSGLSRTGGFVAHADDSSDEDTPGHAGQRRQVRGNQDEDEEEEIGWDASGAYVTQRREAPVVIAPLANRDWRNSSRSTAQRSVYLPESARAALSGEEVVTRETTDTGLATGGLRLLGRRAAGAAGREGDAMEVDDQEGATPAGERQELTLEQRAMRALMAGDEGEEPENIGAIPVAQNERQAPISEEEAFRRDVETRPQESSLDDYARVPVASFGMALLKGMGWKEGQAASRTRTGMVTPYEPKARPALLGIGAKEREQPELKKGEKPKNDWKKRQEAKVYVPVIKTSRESSVAGPSRNVTPSSSRRPSRSRSPPSRPASSSSRRRSRSREREYERDDRERSSQRRDDDRYSSSRRDDREGSSRRESDRDSSSRRDDRDRGSSRRYEDDRDRDRDRDRRRESDRGGDDRRRQDDRDRDRRR